MSRWHLPILLGLLLRILLILVSPDGGMTGGDFQVYHGVANRLASSAEAWTGGVGFGWRAPLFFIYLAFVYLPFAGNAPFWVGQLATSVLFVPTALLLGHLGVRLGLSQRAALVLVWLRCALPMFVIADVQPLSEPLFALILVAFFITGIDVAEDPRRRGKVVLFSLLGVGMVLTREVGAVFFLFGGLALLPHLWRFGPRTLIRAGLWATLGTVLALSPWLYRNHVTYGRALPISATSGFNLHVGNHPDADGRWVLPEAAGHVAPDSLRWSTREWDRWHRDQALSYIAHHPGRFLELIPRRLAYLFFPRAARSEIISLDIFPGLSRFWKYALVGLSALSSAVLVLSIPMGFRLAPPGYFRNASLLGSLGFILSVALTHGMPRFLDPVMHLVLPGLAVFLARPRTLLGAFKGRDAWAMAAFWLVIAGLWALIVLEKA